MQHVTRSGWMLLLLFFLLALKGVVSAQVSTGYTFSQSNDTYQPLVADFPSTPANIFSTSWDDDSYTGYTLPFDFFYNGILYPAGTVIGVDTDAWIAFNPGTMTGQTGGGSWVSTSVSDGAYLSGTANNNGLAAMNSDHWYQDFTSVTGNITSGSNVVTGVSNLTNIRVGTRLTGNANIPDGTVVIATGAGQFTMSANATGTSAGASITPSASIFAKTRGTAPNRQFVIQWTQTKRYSGANNDNFSFQIILEEAPPQQIKVVYGSVSTNVSTSLLTQVGLRGASSADFNARSSSSSWPATSAAAANTNSVALSKTNAPASGLTFIWSPVCPAMANPGAVTGAVNVCPGTTQNYSIPTVPGAGYYVWSYSGTGVSLPATTATPSATLVFASNATSGTLTVRPANACIGAGIAVNTSITIKNITPAAIAYAGGSAYCTSNTPVNVTQSGPSGGTYSVAPAGLTINNLSGQITPSTSTSGSYTVSYSYSDNGCTSVTTTTAVTIKPTVNIVTSSTPPTICGSGSAQLSAIPDGGANYSVTSVAHNLLNPSGAATIIWNTNQDDAVSSPVSIPFPFSYFGQSINQFTVSTNGFIEMGGTSGSSGISAQTIPSTNTPNNVIALAWRDLILDLAANPVAYVRYFTNGAAPNRIMVIEYSGMSFYNSSSGTGIVTGQIRLYESDNHIEVHVKVDDGGLNLSKTLGIENSSGSIGLSPANRNNVQWNAIVPEGWSFSLAGYTYSWTPANFLNNTALSNPVAANLNVATSYTVTATNNQTGCSNSATQTVGFANTQILSSNGATRCDTGSVTLIATANAGNIINWYTASAGGSIAGTGNNFSTPSLNTATTYYVSAEAIAAGTTVAIGSGTNTASSYDGIFYHLFGGSQSQFLIRASELSAAGLSPGDITQLGIRFAGVSAQAYSGFAISMLQTANANMSGGLNSAAFTGVYSTVSYTPTTGINTFTLSTPFSWDGTRNIIVKLCWSNNNTGGTSNYVQTDATTFVSCAYYRADLQTPASVCGGTTATSTLSSRPQFYLTGNATSCASPRTAVTATINPKPTALAMTPTSVTTCGMAATLSFTGGTYSAGLATAYALGFETFPPSDFAVSGAGVTATSNSTYFSEGSKSVLLTYSNNLSATGTNNAYRQTTGVNLSSYSSATLSFRHICALEGSFTTYDAGYVQYSTDGGINWTTFPSSSYTGPGTLMTTVNAAAVSGTIFSTKSYPDWAAQFTGGSVTPGTGPAASLWKSDSIKIPAAALTSDFRIRFMITSDASTRYYGWLIDDIKITVPATNSAPVVWSPVTGLFTDAATTTAYAGTPATTLYTKPGANTTYTATATAPGGCTAVNTVEVTVRPSNTWLGINANWNDIVNWCPVVPTSSTDVTVNTGVPFMPVLSSGSGSVRNLTLQNGASLTIRNATMSVSGTITAPGNIIADSGTLELNGSSPQNISGSYFSNRNLRNLIASNDINISSAAGDTLRILGALSFGNVNNKAFNSGNNVTLVSNAGGTARIADITNNNTNSGNTLLGKFVVERYIPARRAWRLLTTPLSAGQQTINQAWQENTNGNWAQNPNPGYGTHITGGTTRTTAQGFDQGPYNSSIYGYSGTSWNIIPPATNTELVTTRPGYMVFIRGSRSINLPNSSPATVPDATVLRPTGTVRFGAQPQVTSPAGGMTTLGNPYPSAINFNSLSRSGLIGGVGGNAYYLWDPNLGGSSGAGAFVTFSWNGSTYDKNILTGGGSSLITNAGVIPSGAAFMVNFNAGGSIGIVEKDKIADAGNTPYVFRPSGDVGKLRLTLCGIGQNGETAPLDGNLITFTEPGNNALENEDARKVNNFYENIASYTDSTRLSIERRKEIAGEGDTLFYHVWNLRQKNYLIEVVPEGMSIPPGLEVFFEDTYLQQRRAMNMTDTLQIGFAVTADPASASTDRFRIVFVPAAVLPVRDLSLHTSCRNGNTFFTWQTGTESMMRGYALEGSADGSFFNTLQFIPTRGSNATYMWTDEQAAASGLNFFRVKGMGIDGTTAYSPVVRGESCNGKPYSIISPNPVQDNAVRLLIGGWRAETISCILYNGIGQRILVREVKLNGNRSVIELNPGQKLSAGTYRLVLEQTTGQQTVLPFTVY